MYAIRSYYVHEHVQVLADEEDGHALFLLLVEHIVNRDGGPDIEAPHRVGGDQEPGTELDLPAEKDLLNVPPRKLAHDMVNRGRRDVVFPHDPLGVRPSGLPVHEGTLPVVIAFQENVVGNVHPGHERNNFV